MRLCPHYDWSPRDYFVHIVICLFIMLFYYDIVVLTTTLGCAMCGLPFDTGLSLPCVSEEGSIQCLAE